MDIKEISNLITAKNYVFQIAIPGTSFLHGKTTVNMALTNNENLESYFEKIAKANSAKHLFIKLFTPNGSSYKARGEHLIFLPETTPVATATNNATPVATPLNGTNELTTETPIKPKQSTMQDKDYIDFKVLEVKYDTLKTQHDAAQSKIVKLEKKVEDLHDENKNLLRDNLTKEDKHELALERAKLEMAKEGKEGLSGMVGELTKDPELLKMLVGVFKPDHPMFKENAQPALEGASDANREVVYTEDKVTNEVLNDIPRVLSQKNGDTIAQIYLLFQEFVNKPDVLKKAQEQFLPDYQS